MRFKLLLLENEEKEEGDSRKEIAVGNEDDSLKEIDVVDEGIVYSDDTVMTITHMQITMALSWTNCMYW